MRTYTADFAGGYVASMLGAWFALWRSWHWLIGSCPSCITRAFPGFQASVLIWMFFGGLLFYEGLGQQSAVGDQP